MATLALGALGYALGGPTGAKIGLTVGALIDGQANAPGYGKLSDLKVSGSSYGVSIPRVWGRARLGGNIIWVKKDAHGNHLVEHQHSVGGGSGGGGTQYTYSATFAVMVCVGETIFPDGSSNGRTATLKRIWCDDLIVYDANATPGPAYPLVLNSNLFWYNGSESQSANSVMVAAETNTPAYRGRAYLMVQDMDLSKFSNRIPNFSVEIDTGSATYGDVAKDLAKLSGLSSSDVDVSAATATLIGFVQVANESADAALASLLIAGGYDMPEVDGVKRMIPRGGSPSFTVNANDLGATTSTGASSNPRYKRVRKARFDLPGRVEVTYLESGNSSQQATQIAHRQSVNVPNVLRYSLPIVMSANQAKKVAQRELDMAWIGADSFQFSLPWKYLPVSPADVGVLPTDAGNARVRVTDVRFNPIGEIEFTAELDAVGTITQPATGSVGPATTGNVSTFVPTAFTAWSGREIQNSDQSKAGFYVAAGGAVGWSSGTVWYSLDGGSSYVQGPTINGRCVFGVTSGTLGSSGAAHDTFDDSNTVGVDLSASVGTLAAVTDAAILAGTNHAVVGSEILGVGTPTLTSASHYTIGHLRRGERSTAMTGHASGERFVLLNANVVRVVVPDSTIGQTVYVKVLNPREALGDVTAQAVVIAAKTPLTTADINLTGVVANAGGAPSIAEGVDSALPSAGSVGRLWVSTDLAVVKRDNGTTWDMLFPALSGDVTTIAGTVSTTLAAVGTAGTYTSVTTDSKGRVTSGSKPTITLQGTTNQVSVSPSSAQDLTANRTFTISLPQSIATSSWPTFAGMTLTDRLVVNSSNPSQWSLILSNGVLRTDASSSILGLDIVTSDLTGGVLEGFLRVVPGSTYSARYVWLGGYDNSVNQNLPVYIGYRAGFGTTAPASTAHVYGNSNNEDVSGAMTVENAYNGSSAAAKVALKAYGATGFVAAFASAYSDNSLLGGRVALRALSGGGVTVYAGSGMDIRFITSDTERARFVSGGRLLIGTTTDDGASAIQVSGTARVNDQLGIGTAAVTTAPLAVRDGDIYGRIRIISAGINSAGWEIRTDKGDSASHGWSIFDRNAGATRISLDGSGVFSILNLSSGFVVASGSGALSSRLIAYSDLPLQFDSHNFIVSGGLVYLPQSLGTTDNPNFNTVSAHGLTSDGIRSGSVGGYGGNYAVVRDVDISYMRMRTPGTNAVPSAGGILRYSLDVNAGVSDDYVKLDGGLKHLADVDTTGLADGKALVYDNASSKWKPKTVSLKDYARVQLMGGEKPYTTGVQPARSAAPPSKGISTTWVPLKIWWYRTADAGGDTVNFTIKKNGTSILNANITLTASTATSGTSTDFTSSLTFTTGDILTVDFGAIGAASKDYIVILELTEQ